MKPFQDRSGMLDAAPEIGIPLNYPISPDLEDRRGNQSTIPPPPSLLDQARSGLNTFEQKARLAARGVVNLYHGRDAYAPDPQLVEDARRMYRPGYDAASQVSGRTR